jgi:hypothetical protein
MAKESRCQTYKGKFSAATRMSLTPSEKADAVLC